MPLGETFVGAVLNVLFDRLTSPELVRFLRQDGFETKINKWRWTLEMINEVLADAEEKQHTSNAVKEWLDDLEELAYDAEDMLDEFEYEATARKIKMDQLQSSKFWKHVPAGFCNWGLDAIKFRFRMRSKLNGVTTRFDQLCQLRQDLGLQVNTEAAPSTSSVARWRPLTTCIPTEPAVYGRDADKEILLDMVLNDDPNDSNLLVITIVGMAGVGKTTLAREVYNDMVVKSFEARAWICVSDGEFNVARISEAILENITASPCQMNDLATVQHQLKEKVNGKKLLLVLDDVWSVDCAKWELLQSPFRASAVGSRIIVTTRDKHVASKLRASIIQQVRPLKSDDCWSVFSIHAFETAAVQEHHEIELIREKVVAMSDGLPLAAKTLGGLLRWEKMDAWLGILNNKLWDLSEKDGNDIPAALKLSYHHLPSHLRRCFAYCSIFPKDHEFEIEDVVLLWIAEGLIQQSTKSGQLEELGYIYFFDLLGRSMFQQLSSDNGHKFVMPNLVQDLAQWAFGERNLRLDGVSAANGQSEGLKKVRHFSYTSEKHDGQERFKVFQEVEELKARMRTFFPIPQYHANYITDSVPFDLLPKLKRLRVLSLRTYRIAEAPIPIGSLKHLRYLNLSSTMIRSLPESTSLLYNLQILMLRDCYRLVKLPSNLKYLIKLHHLDIKGSILIKEMPLGMKALKNLRKLSNFIVSKGVGSSLKDLMSLEMLCGELCITKLDNVIHSHHKDLILRDKKGLRELVLEWTSHFHESRSEDTEEQVLDMLRPHKNLQQLTITCYGGTKFPSWVGAAAYSNIEVLVLKNCEKCTYIPSFGVLVSLQELTIKGMKGLTQISSEFYGNGGLFKSLRTLCFEDLPAWAAWEPIAENEYGDAFPCLKKLSIKFCPKLSRSLPRHLFALEELVIENCEELVVSISNIPVLCKMSIHGCKRISCDNPVDFKSITYVTLSHISEFSQLLQECFGKAEPQQIKHNRSEVQLDKICPEKPTMGGLQSIRSLTELVISECSNIVSFPEVCSLPHLSKLEIWWCNALISLPKEMKIKNAYIKSLLIWSCDSLACIVRGELPPSLERLQISNCEKLESLWDDRDNGKNANSSLLEYLNISYCPSLMCLSSIIQLPATLKHLEFVSCQQLTKLSQSGLLPASLEHLKFIRCPQLLTITEGFHDSNSSVAVIWIEKCENLQIPNGLHNLKHLRELTIWDCPTIESFPEEGLANTNLRQLQIQNCEKLKALPVDLRSLDSLEDLRISKCPSITSLNPKEEFPTILKYLVIDGCENVYRPLVEWGLHNLTSLSFLQIRLCLDMESFSLMLPPSLIGLTIESFPKLKHLWSQSFLNLTSLQSLTISNCPYLTSLGNQGLPSSLVSLVINNCPKLTRLPKISNILEVVIDGKQIFELEEDEVEVIDANSE